MLSHNQLFEPHPIEPNPPLDTTRFSKYIQLSDEDKKIHYEKLKDDISEKNEEMMKNDLSHIPHSRSLNDS